MFEKIIAFSVRQKLFVAVGVMVLIGFGIYALRTIPLDAVPDITTNQVQIVTTSSSLTAEDVEISITYPIELAMANIPGIVEIRSISRYGLSLVTVVFEDDVPLMRARQFVSEQLKLAAEDIPEGLGTPQMMPITTGLGEVYQYVLEVDEDYRDQYSPMDLRTMQNWLVKRRLSGIEGLVEVSSFGGFVKQFEVGIDPLKLRAYKLTVGEVQEALERNNANAGGGYYEKGSSAIYLRSDGLIRSLKDLEMIPVSQNESTPILIRDIATVKYGHAIRYGAITKNGNGEAVGGITLMLKGANADDVVEKVKQRVEETQAMLPPGISISPYLVRSELIGRTIKTVITNLAEGGILVTLILVFFLGNFRAGLLVASVIPLAMLFALICMKIFGVSANLMSLGAIDFGIVVDGAVIVVEGILHYQAARYVAGSFRKEDMDQMVITSSSRIYSTAAFGVLIILVVFIPVLQLGGIEGKMFKPMALTLMFALAGAMILSLTYIPAAAAVLLKNVDFSRKSFGEKLMDKLRSAYVKSLHKALSVKRIIVPAAFLLFLISIWRLATMGAVFLPELEEGDLAMQMAVPPGSNLQTTIATATEVEKALLHNFPEVKHVVSKIGTAEVPTDPMAIEDADVMILLQPKSQWTSAETREELVSKMKKVLKKFPEVSFEFTQPIQLRFNELITGSKAEIAVKIFGPDPEKLHELGLRAEELIANVQGAGDVKLERTQGLKQEVVRYNRAAMSRYGINVEELNSIIETAYAGKVAGVVYQGNQRFDLVLRLGEASRGKPDLSELYTGLENKTILPISEFASFEEIEGPAMVSRENTERRITIGVNATERSTTEVVADIAEVLEGQLELPSGYRIVYDGEFKNFEVARNNLAIAVPIALALILFLLYLAYSNIKYALLVFTAVPLSAIGGVWLLELRGMPFSISAGVGFIALFGVAVLNAIVLISHINHLKEKGGNLMDIIVQGSADRLRPVLLTALVATFGFIPLALSRSAGAEVQKPLATVVIGGLITATLLTLYVLPMIYALIDQWRTGGRKKIVTFSALILFLPFGALAQNGDKLSFSELEEQVYQSNPRLRSARSEVEIAEILKKDAWQLEATEVNYSYGQLNRADIEDDYTWNFKQSIGSIPQHLQRAKFRDANARAAELDYRYFELGYEAALKKSYLIWVYAEEKRLASTETAALLDSLLTVIIAQAEAGEISMGERYIFEGQVLNYQSQLKAKELAAMNAKIQLEQIALIPLSEKIPGEGEDYALSLPVPDSLSTLGIYASQEVLSEAGMYRYKMMKAALFPSFSLGYQIGRIEGVPNADAFQLGMSIPIWFGPDKAEANKAKLEWEIEHQNLEIAQAVARSNLEGALERYRFHLNRFAEEGSIYKRNSTELVEKSLYSYRIGEINAQQLISTLTAASEIYQTYLDMLEDLGISKINLIAFTKP